MYYILHVATTEDLGGIERFLVNLYSHINRNRYKFFVICMGKKSPIGDDIAALGGKIIYINKPGHIISYILDLMTVFSYKKWDIVHFHKNSLANAVPLYLAMLLSRKSKKIIHSHNTAPKVSSRILNYMHAVNRFIFCSMKWAHLACSDQAGRWMFGKREFKVVRNGINISSFRVERRVRESVRDRMGIPSDRIILGNVASFIPQKNHKFLLNIFKTILNKDNRYCLMLLGEGPLQQNFIKEADDMGIGEHVFFLGVHKDIRPYLYAMDAFVMPSLFEGLPISAIEAQASGLPLFISDNVDHDVQISKDVFFIKELSIPETWRNQIMKYFQNNRMRNNFENTSKGNMYDVKHTAESVMEIYSKLLNDK